LKRRTITSQVAAAARKSQQSVSPSNESSQMMLKAKMKKDLIEIY
jgi:hypothetical protein